MLEMLITMLNAKRDASRSNPSVDCNRSSRSLDRWVGRPTSPLLDQSGAMIVTRGNVTQAGLQILPGTFAGLMDLYEHNYIGIRRLIPLMPPAATCQVSHIAGGLSLYLQVLERFRYTTELSLTYHFAREGGIAAEPDLRIRVYHDARLAEVMSAQLRRGLEFQLGEETAWQTQLSARWHVNRFLYKWLNYCLHQGHRFGTGSQT